jgi:beta-glucanase (GH16 family)
MKVSPAQIVGVFVVVACTCGSALGASAPDDWRLVWADEFQQADGSAPDPAKWVHDSGAGIWGNNELQIYTDRRLNSRIEGGKLIIEARKEALAGADGVRRDYTSARLKSLSKASWTFGRIEARIKVPRGQGIWPAFWMLGTNITTVDWPACGEIDIMENVGHEPSTVHGTIHGPGYSGGGGIGGAFTLTNVALADDFHLFAIEWEPTRIRWFVDKDLYLTVTPTNLPAAKTWVFNHDQFLLLNVAVGGDWPGNPDASTSFPQRMEVDYVRVWARNDAAASPPSTNTQRRPPK